MGVGIALGKVCGALYRWGLDAKCGQADAQQIPPGLALEEIEFAAV
jgi:hypothetical protein